MADCTCPDHGPWRETHCRAARYGLAFTSDDWCDCKCHTVSDDLQSRFDRLTRERDKARRVAKVLAGYMKEGRGVCLDPDQWTALRTALAYPNAKEPGLTEEIDAHRVTRERAEAAEARVKELEGLLAKSLAYTITVKADRGALIAEIRQWNEAAGGLTINEDLEAILAKHRGQP